jgi:acetyl/propionyl-CoA carboxylase alpha subunit
MRHLFTLNDVAHALWLSRHDGGYRLDLGARNVPIQIEHEDERSARLRVDGAACYALVAVDGDTVHLNVDGATYALRYRDPIDHFAKHSGASADDLAVAPMPGTVVSISVAAEQSVARGDTLLVIESMKLETAIKAWRDGTIDAVHVTVGRTFERSAPLVTFKPESRG